SVLGWNSKIAGEFESAPGVGRFIARDEGFRQRRSVPLLVEDVRRRFEVWNRKPGKKAAIRSYHREAFQKDSGLQRTLSVDKTRGLSVWTNFCLTCIVDQ